METSQWVRRVLVVEDQPLMRALVGDTLTHAGFVVRTAGSAVEALTEFDGFDPDLLVTDIDLGVRPNGVDLANIVTVKAPHCAIVFLTNYPNASTAPGSAGVPPKSLFVDKAAVQSADQLIGVVEAALTETEPPALGSDRTPPCRASPDHSSIFCVTSRSGGRTAQSQRIVGPRSEVWRSSSRALSRAWD